MSARLPFDVIAEQPWALLRSELQRAVDLASSESPVAAATRAIAEPRRQGVIAVLPIHGVIEHRASFLGELLGGTSVEAIRASLVSARDDDDVAAIVLDVDSPGGGVTGITELAADIRKAREQKPIVAVANGTAASAAYWLAAQADRVYASTSSVVGSIGIYAVHMDISKALEAEGVSPTIISAGEHKTEANEYEPLDDDARSTLQVRVDAFYDQFVGDVAKGRGTTAATVRSDYGQGRTMLATEAADIGLVDEVGTLDDAIRQVARTVRSGRSLRAGDQAEALPFGVRVLDQATDLHALVAHAGVRAGLRALEGRPSFSPDVEAALRSIRDDALALSSLLPADPVAQPVEPAQPPPAVEPPVASTSLSPPRFKDRAGWLAYLEASVQ